MSVNGSFWLGRCWLSAGLWLMLLLQSAGLQAAELRCANAPLTIQSEQALADDERRLICQATEQALGFLNDVGLPVQRTIRLELMEQPILNLGMELFGSYDGERDRIQVLSKRAILAQPGDVAVYDQPIDKAHYRGVVAHEVAHAVVAQHAPELNRTAQEYLAHATQLAVLPEDRRQQIIEAANVGPWLSGDVISDIYMAMAITPFAVKCYLHLSGHPRPREVVEMLLISKWRYVVVR